MLEEEDFCCHPIALLSFRDFLYWEGFLIFYCCTDGEGYQSYAMLQHLSLISLLWPGFSSLYKLANHCKVVGLQGVEMYIISARLSVISISSEAIPS